MGAWGSGHRFCKLIRRRQLIDAAAERAGELGQASLAHHALAAGARVVTIRGRPKFRTIQDLPQDPPSPRW
jgi:hypothetical protein